MKAHLLYRDRDFDWRWALRAAAVHEATRTGRRLRDAEFDPRSGLPWNADALSADLALATLFEAMAQGDDCIFEVTRKVILNGVSGDLDTIRYRQAILQDCLAQAPVVRELYLLAAQTIEQQRAHFLGLLTRYPDSVLRDAIETIVTSLKFLRRLREIADLHIGKFSSEGWAGFFARLQRDLNDEYFTAVEGHLEELRFRNGELLSAKLGKANKGSAYVLHRTPYRKSTWKDWWAGFFEKQPAAYSFEIHPRDEAGAQALTALRNRGISLAANALGQAADHLREFFRMLRVELAFYVGCINLHERLTEKGEPTCIPTPAAAGEQRLTSRELYDVGLALTVPGRVVGNDVEGDGKRLIIITGPNTGGKSTFLRSLGLAQLMMQSGMFVAAQSYCGSVCAGLFTHYKREEDAAMESGKFDEELSRMSEIIDHLAPDSMVLFNESFAATNEREGSEIARQILSAIVEKDRAIYVTHMYELACGFYARARGDALFLRAQRAVDGARTFKIAKGEPLPTSFGQDLYNRIFCAEPTQSTRPVTPDKVLDSERAAGADWPKVDP